MLRAVRSLSSVVVMAMALFYLPIVWAHHSFASTYSSQTVTIEGTVSEFLFRSPHSVILVEVVEKGGQKVSWAAEWYPAGQLSRHGIEKDTFKAGDHVIIRGNPSRNTVDHRLRMEQIERPSDGWKWTD